MEEEEVGARYTRFKGESAEQFDARVKRLEARRLREEAARVALQQMEDAESERQRPPRSFDFSF